MIKNPTTEDKIEKKKKNRREKTKEEVLDQLYVSAYDLLILNPTMSYSTALNYVKEKRKEMKNKNLFVPPGQTKVVLMKLVKKDWGF